MKICWIFVRFSLYIHCILKGNQYSLGMTNKYFSIFHKEIYFICFALSFISNLDFTYNPCTVEASIVPPCRCRRRWCGCWAGPPGSPAPSCGPGNRIITGTGTGCGIITCSPGWCWSERAACPHVTWDNMTHDIIRDTAWHVTEVCNSHDTLHMTWQVTHDMKHDNMTF